MSEQVMESYQDLFADIQCMNRTKIVQQYLTYVNDGKLFQINQTETTPKGTKYNWAVDFFRTYSDCILTTNKYMSNNLFDVSRTFTKHKFDQKVYFNDQKTKPIGIMMKNMQLNFYQTGSYLYKEKNFKKIILTKQQNLERYLEYQSQQLQIGQDQFVSGLRDQHGIHFNGLKEINFGESVNCLREKYNYEMIVSECGQSATKDYFDEQFIQQNPIDTIVFTLYLGNTKSNEELNAAWSFTVWKRKSQKDLERQEEQKAIKNKDQLLEYLDKEKQALILKKQQRTQDAQAEKNQQYGSNSPIFMKKKYKFLGDREFQTKKIKE
ncbi:UNKNOWN [Stylonychia lemnae]|uniref:Uncharacterized protein n=1 Tax=Stylonychia lemnae TaxID=5949 RepID=A0A077ZWF5_STYLE|nr:UNKNOWN [Stylonychia lemnae]|eukprot:CDW72776.1 UNKNOWN [Stylonychia lemnae]